MSTLEEKLEAAGIKQDGVTARAWLKRHLAHKGYIVVESDNAGPTRILVNSMSLSEWKRVLVDLYKGGRSKGRARDCLMELVSERPWIHV